MGVPPPIQPTAQNLQPQHCKAELQLYEQCHTKAQINKPSKQSDQIDNSCNCRNKNTCPPEGNCNTRNIVYQTEVTTPQTKETYIGLCDTTFKERYSTEAIHVLSGTSATKM